jgi:hypothetical protein
VEGADAVGDLGLVEGSGGEPPPSAVWVSDGLWPESDHLDAARVDMAPLSAEVTAGGDEDSRGGERSRQGAEASRDAGSPTGSRGLIAAGVGRRSAG